MGKQMPSLEEYLGVQLLERGYRRITFTDTNERLFNAAKLSVIRLLEQLDADSSLNRTQVMFTVSIETISLWLVQLMAELEHGQPRIDARIAADDHISDLAIRYGSADRSSQKPEHMFDETVAPVASALLSVNKTRDINTLAGFTVFEFEEAPSLQAAIGALGAALVRLELMSTVLDQNQLARVPCTDSSLKFCYSYCLVHGHRARRDDGQVVARWLHDYSANTRRAVKSTIQETTASARRSTATINEDNLAQ